MSTRVVEQVDDWNQRSFGGGYRELQALADEEFSGVVRADGAELFMTRGTVVGIRRGSIDAFEGASGTVYDAPTDALPLLAVMQDRSDEVRAKYYTEDTGISEVDRTLEDGNFTGYVELSENVLSGDYYLVYHRGHSMAVAYVGNAGQLLTEDEAFERADGEVGIYEVRPVDIEPIEVPEPTEPVEEESEDGGATAAAGVDADREEASGDGTGQQGEAATSADATDDGAADAADRGTAAESDATEQPDAPAPADGDDPATTDDEEGAAAASTDGREAAADADGTGTGERERPDQSSERESEASTAATGTREQDREASGGDDATTSAESAGDAGQRDADGQSATADPRRRDGRDSADGAAAGGQGATGDGARASGGGASAAASTPDTASDADAVPSATTEADRSPPTPSGSAERDAASPTRDSGQTTEEAEARDAPRDLETRSIPSLDPEQTSAPNQSSDQSRRDAPGRSDTQGAPQRAQNQHQSAETRQQQSAGQSSRQAGTADQSGQEASAPEREQPAPDRQRSSTEDEPADTDEADAAVGERIEELQDLLDEREKEINRLESDLESAESERESLRRELQQVREERDELRDEVESLESELERLEDELGAATDAQQRMTPQEALSGTDIFVRYRSKGDATLEKAHGGSGFREDVVENLRLEKHTQFDADAAAVGGREYEEFLEDTVAYRFVRWVVEELLFEIQSTGHTESLTDLYDALPKINRVELNGAVNVTYTEDGQETETTESFDVVFRERMGDPLLVANINDSRQGATESMMEGLITSAERVGQTTDQFASAFLVTESFFEPEALETVSEATRGGLLSRDKRKSFVNLSRKRGYHLCLVEARNQNFHLEVPEL